METTLHSSSSSIKDAKQSNTGGDAKRVINGGLQIDKAFFDFINQEVIPGSGCQADNFWQGFENILKTFTARNEQLLAKRSILQNKIDTFHQSQADASFEDYKKFLHEIGYLVDAPEPFSISTTNTDKEIATMAGPQLVVPINNARYALNAVNARWGSLYDALYGTDVIEQSNGLEKTKTYNLKRGLAVIKKAREYLDLIAPLASGSHLQSIRYAINNGRLEVTLEGETKTVSLKDESQFVGYQGTSQQISALLIKHNELHAEIQIDKKDSIGQSDPAGIKDILLEAALTTIMDCEDSVAAVDAQDKIKVYRNWLGLMRGDLSITMQKGDAQIKRSMAPDRVYHKPESSNIHDTLTLSGRSLMFNRNVGHLMRNDAILFEGEHIFEGIMDGVVTSLIAKHDLRHNGRYKNSKTGSIYIVKPKMHGPEEVALTHDLFNAVEDLLDLPRYTIKVGIMDEERRTSVNLAACIHGAKERVVFINTGFLDRTGDEIHTSMLKGAFAPKAELKQMPWIGAYENANVSIGLQSGLSGKAQIGKGMWPIPDQMANMLEAKIAHPQSGANTAWVPSPTGATLHALHYHQVKVFDIQQGKLNAPNELNTILQIPLLGDRQLSQAQINNELDNNIQGILGYVVRWVHQGIGCSKVPDINNVGLMEDRATLRISSQHIANWLEHKLISPQQVEASLLKMAALVDSQNSKDADYIPMGPDYASSIGFQAATELIFKGKRQPSGYTEPLLHAKRLEMKRALLAKN
jgi:malate synthase